MVGLRVAALLAALFAVGESIRCYTGSSISLTDMSGHYIDENCDGSCRTSVTTIGSSTVVARSCYSLGTCQSSSSSSTSVTCCNTNLCNAAVSNNGGSNGGSNGENSGGTGGTSGKQCYSCMFGCDDPFDPDQASLVSCSGQCQKYVIWAGDLSTVTRSCDTSCSPTDARIGGSGVQTLCCDGDKCNTGATVTANMAAMLVTLGAAILVLFY